MNTEINKLNQVVENNKAHACDFEYSVNQLSSNLRTVIKKLSARLRWLTILCIVGLLTNVILFGTVVYLVMTYRSY